MIRFKSFKPHEILPLIEQHSVRQEPKKVNLTVGGEAALTAWVVHAVKDDG